MKNYTKNNIKEINKLSNLAYKRELSAALNNLEKKFEEWNKGDIDCFELNDLIHKYHNNTARELYDKYNNNDLSDITIAWTIANGIISKNEVSKELINKLEDYINRYS